MHEQNFLPYFESSWNKLLVLYWIRCQCDVFTMYKTMYSVRINLETDIYQQKQICSFYAPDQKN